MQLTTVKIDKPEDINFVLGQSHFIKTVEDIHEALYEAVPGIRSIPFHIRLVMMWAAVALMPMISILAVALSFPRKPEDYLAYYGFASGLVFVSALSGGGIFWLVGRDLWRWIHLQTDATGQIAQGQAALYVAETATGKFGVYTMLPADVNGSGVGLQIRRHDMTTFRLPAKEPAQPAAANQ